MDDVRLLACVNVAWLICLMPNKLISKVNFSSAKSKNMVVFSIISIIIIISWKQSGTEVFDSSCCYSYRNNNVGWPI